MGIQKLLENQKNLFWFLHFSGWLGYGVITWIGARAHDVPSAYNYVILATVITGFFLSLALRYMFHYCQTLQPVYTGLLSITSCYLVTIPWIFSKNWSKFYYYKGGWYPDSIFQYLGGITASFYIILLWAGLYYGIKYYRMLQKEREATLKANSIAHEAQLKMLRYQLNPHFLFNTLNAISTLILETDTHRANNMVTRLSNFLRYSLDNDPMQKIALQKEIDALRLYLDIEKVRFEERLELVFDIETDAAVGLIPSLLLQPLVENSIKYAVAISETGGRITVRAKKDQDTLHIEVSDDGPGVQLVDGEIAASRGVGVSNTSNRLEELYGEKHSFKLSNLEPKGLKVEICIPFESEK
ncbi:MAG: two-component system LytT family sensor kinase [Enterobacterales bacterium]|jgi:two-component system LytT family sensor kinase